jgi:hypothetical protein
MVKLSEQLNEALSQFKVNAASDNREASMAASARK